MRLRLVIANIAMLTLESLGESQTLRRLTVARSALENDFIGFAITAFNGVYNSRSSVRRDDQPIRQQENRLGEVNIQQGLR